MKLLDKLRFCLDSEESLGPVKPIFVECACHRWFVEMWFASGEKLYVPESFDSKMDATMYVVDWVDLYGVETSEVS
jgi:hypothetical protein